MAVAVTIPKATISMEEVTLLRWHKHEGDAVTAGDVLFEMETDKALTEVPAPADGVLLCILAVEGPVKVEEVVGWIGQPGETVDQDLKPLRAAQSPTSSEVAGEPLQQVLGSQRIIATPAARRRATELKVDLATVSGTGPGGRIKEEDVERFVELNQPQDAATAGSGFFDRKTLIQNLTRTWQSVPHIHISRRLDAAGLAEGKQIARSKGWLDVSITDLVLCALSKTLPQFPDLTMTWHDDRLEAASQLNLAFAVDTQRGVVAPVIPNAGTLSLEALSKRRQELTSAARAHRLRLNELQRGVFTLTNLGMEGVDTFVPILNSPQTAILAVGRMSQEPVVLNGSLSIGWRIWANLAVDHRVADGVAAARFLEALQRELDELPGRMR